LTFVKSLVDAGAYPKSFATIKLGESHYYFHTKPGSLMFPMGSFYTGRAFVPPDKGGQPENFPLGVMAFPAMDEAACNQCKTLTIGASFILNAASKNQKLAADMLNEMTTPEMGTLWLETILLQTAIKSDASKVGGKYAEYFKELLDRNKDAQYFVGIPRDHIQGKCRDAFTQVLNNAFPGGLLTGHAVAHGLPRAAAGGWAARPASPPGGGGGPPGGPAPRVRVPHGGGSLTPRP